MILIIS